jgi:UDP-glucose 4-epimerase
MPKTILLTGAAGYIASHTWLALAQSGYRVIGVDNFVNSSPQVLERISKLLDTGAGATTAPLDFVEADVCSVSAMRQVFKKYTTPIDAVVHFAALKSVGESTQKPLSYYANNLGSLVNVAQVMQEHDCHHLVFSSSATVYGQPESLPIFETARLDATNPYGQTKLMGEQILRDLEQASKAWRIAYLRYFNPVGAHPSGTIGEDPRGIPNNLMPYVAQVAVGKREKLHVFGNDYPTPDGTGVRDYIHVMDLAAGHVAALKYLFEKQQSITVNLGTGKGHSVLEVIKAYEKASGKTVPYEMSPRRPGDAAACYADVQLAREQLQWTAQFDLDAMCRDSWHWQSQNPNGFGL